ncbi:hypothetical protein [Kocuria sp.]|uniref:hypothetical protein n=1 Tax=Kocuria sp. TaxID=1871328 RepID=UPI0026E00D4B|nr:hypothetical protein [Kocuria sp.]MDO5618245.1 hypothetical protein [Kocuria sp.]
MSKHTTSREDSAAVAAEWSVPPESARAATLRAPLPARSVVWWTLLILLLVNAFFMLANVAHNMGDGTEEGILGIFAPLAWEGDYDGSHIEIWGHIQLFAAAVVLAVLARAHRSALLGAWGFALFVVVVDDLFQVHEEAGEVLAESLGLQPALGLRPEDFGELLIWAVLGIMVLVPLVTAYLKADAWARKQSWVMVGILALLAVFAIGLDMLAIMLQGHVPGQVLRVVAWTETLGEIVPMSLFLAFAVKLAVAPEGFRTRKA